MAKPADDQNPPKFEISDLSIHPSNPIYPGAIRCVQAYWKQATSMTPDQRDRYLLYLQGLDQKDSFVMPLLGENLTSRAMFQCLCSLSDNFPFKRLSWAAYLFLSAWYVHLPTEYIAEIEYLHGTSLIRDHTAKYRSIYLATLEFLGKTEVVEVIVSSQQPNAITPIMKNYSVAPASTKKQNATLEQQTDNVASTSSGKERKNVAVKKKKDSKSPAPTCQQQNDTPTKKKDPTNPAATKQEKPAVVPASANIHQLNVAPAHDNNEQIPVSSSKQENTTSTVVQLPPATPTTPQFVGAESWNIDNVVGILSESKKKRLASSAENFLKRTRVNDNEVWGHVNQQATMTKSALEKLQSTVEHQGAKLQEACAAAEQNKQTLDSMQGELRQFMSAVASTLRDIQDRLEE